jgi:hypothetical protein
VTPNTGRITTSFWPTRYGILVVTDEFDPIARSFR